MLFLPYLLSSAQGARRPVPCCWQIPRPSQGASLCAISSLAHPKRCGVLLTICTCSAMPSSFSGAGCLPFPQRELP